MEKKERKHIKIGSFVFKVDDIRTIENLHCANEYKIELCNGRREIARLGDSEFEEVCNILTKLTTK